VVSVEFSDQALRDLRDISRFGFRLWHRDQVAAYMGDLRASIVLLGEFPERGLVHQHDESGVIRRIVHRRHAVLYQFSGEIVVVLRVLSVRAAVPDMPGISAHSDDL